jgi:hypothetical protein
MAWIDRRWKYRRRIIIQKAFVDADLVNFPLFVPLRSDYFVGSRCRPDGRDVRFATAEGLLLPYETENFDLSPDHAATASFWTKVPSITAAQGGEIYLYFGNLFALDGQNPGGTWDSNFKGVWHLKEVGAGILGEFKDSTSNANHGQGGGGFAGVPTRVAGNGNYAQEFFGGQTILIPDNGTLELTGGKYTVEFFARKDSDYWSGMFVKCDGTNTTRQWGIADGNAPDNVCLFHFDGYFTTGLSQQWRVGTWRHLATTVDNATSTRKVYVDGVEAYSGSWGCSLLIDQPWQVYIGSAKARFYFDGKLEQPRASNINRSAAWIKFTAKNVLEADHELEWGPLETVGDGAARAAWAGAAAGQAVLWPNY